MITDQISQNKHKRKLTTMHPNQMVQTLIHKEKHKLRLETSQTAHVWIKRTKNHWRMKRHQGNDKCFWKLLHSFLRSKQITKYTHHQKWCQSKYTAMTVNTATPDRKEIKAAIKWRLEMKWSWRPNTSGHNLTLRKNLTQETKAMFHSHHTKRFEKLGSLTQILKRET